MIYVYKRQQRYWPNNRLVRRALKYAISAGVAALAGYLLLQVRW